MGFVGIPIAGNGGGRATITATNCINDGSIRANGQGAFDTSGGGSGGSILINVGVLSGTGLIEARGGPGGFTAGGGNGGGGGRIAIYYDSNLLPSSGVAAGGHLGGIGSASGSAGTIYLKDNAATVGDLIIDNGAFPSFEETPLLTSLVSFDVLTVSNGGTLAIPSDVVPHLFLNDLLLDGSSSLLSAAPRDLQGARITVADGLTLSNGARISVDGDGLLGGGVLGNPFDPAGETFGPDGETVAAGSTAGSGGSYGGLGGGLSPNATYGIPEDPQHVGSGGSGRLDSVRGGNGGGQVWIDATTCDLALGTSLTADGGNASGGSGELGGGSGGGIKLDCETITGEPSFSAAGGSGGGTDINGGGGGRIALRTNNNLLTMDFFSLCDVSGGSPLGSGEPGQVGTCFLGDLVCRVPPGEIVGLALQQTSGVTQISWTVPAEPGTTLPLLYDTVRSLVPSDFDAGAVCLETDGVDTESMDADPLLPGTIAYYLVRAKNDCGTGSPGDNSLGQPRIVASCP
jgi:hypothetical protein